jgi:predicted RNA-binding protein with PUA-like domain
VTGLARIARAGYPDPFAWKKGHKYYNAASAAAKPIWYTVDWNSSNGSRRSCRSSY